MKTNLICITCPIGCRMTVEKQGETFIVEGNQCKRGIAYAQEELTHPTRMVPTTVVIEGAHLPRLPVRTSQPIDKKLIFKCMDLINQVKVTAPVEMGQVIIENILNTGVNIIATRSMDKV